MPAEGCGGLVVARPPSPAPVFITPARHSVCVLACMHRLATPGACLALVLLAGCPVESQSRVSRPNRSLEQERERTTQEMDRVGDNAEAERRTEQREQKVEQKAVEPKQPR